MPIEPLLDGVSRQFSDAPGEQPILDRLFDAKIAARTAYLNELAIWPTKPAPPDAVRQAQEKRDKSNRIAVTRAERELAEVRKAARERAEGGQRIYDTRRRGE